MDQTAINNDFYDELGDRWYTDDSHAIALLRAEAVPKVDYIRDVFDRVGLAPGASVLDVACGAGLVSLPLAEAGYDVTGVDRAADAIAVGRDWGRKRLGPDASVRFRVGDAYALDDADASYDAVLLMDFLEHVERPADVIAEAARVVRPGGVVVYHTFNQTWLADLFAIKGLHLAVRDGPPDLHVYRLFLPPDEVDAMLDDAGLNTIDVQGLRPEVGTWAFWSTLLRRRVHPAFSFTRTSSLQVGYMGAAVKRDGV